MAKKCQRCDRKIRKIDRIYKVCINDDPDHTVKPGETSDDCQWQRFCNQCYKENEGFSIERRGVLFFHS